MMAIHASATSYPVRARFCCWCTLIYRGNRKFIPSGEFRNLKLHATQTPTESQAGHQAHSRLLRGVSASEGLSKIDIPKKYAFQATLRNTVDIVMRSSKAQLNWKGV